MYCHLHRGDWSFHLINEKKKKACFNLPVEMLQNSLTATCITWRLMPVMSPNFFLNKRVDFNSEIEKKEENQKERKEKKITS